MTEVLRRSMSSHFKSFCFKEIVTQLVNPSQSLVRERGLDKQNCSFWPQKSFQWFNISLLKGAAEEIIAILSCGLDGAWVGPYMSTKRILLPNKKKIQKKLISVFSECEHRLKAQDLSWFGTRELFVPLSTWFLLLYWVSSSINSLLLLVQWEIFPLRGLWEWLWMILVVWVHQL